MFKNSFDKYWHANCEKGINKTHQWERLGVFNEGLQVFLVWRCSQCKISLLEKLEVKYG